MTSLSDCNNYEYPSSSPESIIVINVDMLIQILLRLPEKPLLVFKSVSKQWFSIISEPFFRNRYNLQNSLSTQGLFTQSSKLTWRDYPAKQLEYVHLDGSSSSAPFESLSFISDPFGVMIGQSCNDLMCCSSYCCANDYLNIYPTYYICNPCTRQYRPIVCESQKYVKGFKKLSNVSLAYDPLKSPHYRVVCIWLVSRLSNFNYQTEIYSSETASWDLSGEVFSKCHCYYFDSGVFWNGALHWVNTDIRKRSFLYYNVDQEIRMEMEIPVYDEELGKEAGMLVECKGRLYLIPSRVFPPTSFEILEMKTDYKGWSKRYLVAIQELIRPYPISIRFYFNVLLLKEREGESPNLVLPVLDKVIFYDPRDRSIKEIQKVALCNRENVAHQYIQTLASV